MRSLVVMLMTGLLVSCGVVGAPIPPENVGVAVTIERQKRDALDPQQREAEVAESDPALQGQDVNLPPLRPVGTR